jgi:hypothetical protein
VNVVSAIDLQFELGSGDLVCHRVPPWTSRMYDKLGAESSRTA